MIPNRIPPTVAFHFAIRIAMEYNINEIIAIMSITKISFTIPTLEISPIASPIESASPISSVLANLHCAITKANEKIILTMNEIIPDNQCWKMIAKIELIIIGISM